MTIRPRRAIRVEGRRKRFMTVARTGMRQWPPDISHCRVAEPARSCAPAPRKASLMDSPITLVICGASGDLTARKLVPSLYRLHCKKRLPENLRIVGVARSPFSDEAFREKMSAATQDFAKREWTAEQWTN